MSPSVGDWLPPDIPTPCHNHPADSSRMACFTSFLPNIAEGGLQCDFRQRSAHPLLDKVREQRSQRVPTNEPTREWYARCIAKKTQGLSSGLMPASHCQRSRSWSALAAEGLARRLLRLLLGCSSSSSSSSALGCSSSPSAVHRMSMYTQEIEPCSNLKDAHAASGLVLVAACASPQQEQDTCREAIHLSSGSSRVEQAGLLDW